VSGLRTLAAMSGGVDSSVAAALAVRRQGREAVSGVTLCLGDAATGESGAPRCCTPEDMRDARRVADRLGIAHSVISEEEAFRREVLGPFVEEYRRGRTPSPCVRCNTFLKFGTLLERARALGAEGVVTGHYARLARDPDSGRVQLLRGVDQEKDQSYFLFQLSQEQLEASTFPLGELSKGEVRGIARELGLHTAGKRESQDVCFVGLRDYREVLELHGAGGEQEEGPLLDLEGRELGRHPGLYRFTVGQRRGLPVQGPRPLYVVDLVPETRAVVLGEEEALMSAGLLAEEVNWIAFEAPRESFRAEVRIRHGHRPAPAEVRPLDGGRARVLFDSPQRALTPGQAAVFYRGEAVLGGGWIARSS
jgi:tRNA-specific 2-thiouridylase